MAKQQTATKVRLNRRPLLALLILPLVCILVWVMWTSQQKTRADELSSALAVKSLALNAKQARLNALNSGKSTEAQILLAQNQQLDTFVPASVDMISLVQEINSLAGSNGVALGQMNPDASKNITAGSYRAVGFAGEVVGNRDQVIAFFAKLAAYPQLVTVKNITLTMKAPSATNVSGGQASAPGGVSGDTTATFTMYAWSDPSPGLNDQTKAKAANGTPGSSPSVGATGATGATGTQPSPSGS